MRELELSVGEAVKIGDCTITLVDVDSDEASFRVDDAEGMFEVSLDDSFTASK